MSNPVIVAAAITHTFGSGPTAFTALRSIDLEIRPGEVLLMMGPSGSGKTTLLHILGCLLRPTAGAVVLHGNAAQSLDEDQLGALRLRHFGFVFQAYNLFPVLTATENVMVALDLMGVAMGATRGRARELLTLVGLGHRLDAYPGELSSGQKQRVAIARALAGDPEILMADEPTAALDAENGLKAMELFRVLAHDQQRAVVIVTHDPRTCISRIGSYISRMGALPRRRASFPPLRASQWEPRYDDLMAKCRLFRRVGLSRRRCAG